MQGKRELFGIECPSCGCRHLEVSYGRHRRGHYFRKRICRNCGKVVRTQERIMGVTTTVARPEITTRQEPEGGGVREL